MYPKTGLKQPMFWFLVCRFRKGKEDLLQLRHSLASEQKRNRGPPEGLRKDGVLGSLLSRRLDDSGWIILKDGSRLGAPLR